MPVKIFHRTAVFVEDDPVGLEGGLELPPALVALHALDSGACMRVDHSMNTRRRERETNGKISSHTETTCSRRKSLGVVKGALRY